MLEILELSTESVKKGLFLEFTKSVQLTFYSEVSSYFTGETQKVFIPSFNQLTVGRSFVSPWKVFRDISQIIKGVWDTFIRIFRDIVIQSFLNFGEFFLY